jgi:GntR family transcriptional regulator, transcriptional repressor for pyruvate dehydrogenase complex
MVFETIRKATAPEMVVEQILNQLKTGDLTPGGQLPSQRELAHLLGVGRSSVREAINALTVMGYLDVHQGKGTFIRRELPATDPSVDKLNAAFKAGSFLDLTEARELLECKSAELAAERAGKAHIRNLRQVIERVEKTEKEYSIFLQADIDFHVSLAQATQNVVICEMTRLVLEKVVAYHTGFETTLISPEYRQRSIHSARQVVTHVARGEGQAAAEWMRLHLHAIRSELKDILPV